MKMGILCYVISILEGMLSGVCFYEASKKEGREKISSIFLGLLWFACSFTYGLLGNQELKEAREAEIDPDLEPEL